MNPRSSDVGDIVAPRPRNRQARHNPPILPPQNAAVAIDVVGFPDESWAAFRAESDGRPVLADLSPKQICFPHRDPAKAAFLIQKIRPALAEKPSMGRETERGDR